MKTYLEVFKLFIVLSLISAQKVESLQKFNVDANETSVSGLSSGAFFATQIQVAFSSIIKGAGIIAGGPYDCGGQTLFAMCMYMTSPSVSTSIAKTNEWSGSAIDDKSNLRHQKVYMISGSKDMTVATSVMDQLYKYYVTESQYIPSENVVYKKDLVSGHTFPTDFDGAGNVGCSQTASPFISNCGFDSAGAILKHIYGDLKPKNTGSRTGSFVEFDQSEYTPSPLLIGLDTKGWMYVPTACAGGQKCKLHIALHGCQQSYSQIGDKFVQNTGYDRWADTNNIIVVYPQTHSTFTLHYTPSNFWSNNLNACWDWIGFYDIDFPTKNGSQMKFIHNIIDKIASK